MLYPYPTLPIDIPIPDGVCARHVGSKQDPQDACTQWIGLFVHKMLNVRWKYGEVPKLEIKV
jgi:hypothetical protein